jgi:hypothetical protein
MNYILLEIFRILHIAYYSEIELIFLNIINYNRYN